MQMKDACRGSGSEAQLSYGFLSLLAASLSKDLNICCVRAASLSKDLNICCVRAASYVSKAL